MRSSDPAVFRADTLRLRWLTVVLVVMAALTIGWPLINLAVPNRRTLVAGTMLKLGPGQTDLAKFTVGSGWTLVPSDTDPRLDYSLRHGLVGLTLSYVAIINNADTAQLWAGFRQAIRVSNPGLELGQPAPYTTVMGLKGDQGKVASRTRTGTATLIRTPSGTFAVEMILLGPRHAGRANLAAAHQVMHSLKMPTRAR